MTTTQAQQLDRCARSLRRAECSLASSEPRCVSALMDARDEIDATLRTLRWRPRPRVSPGVLAVFAGCLVLTAIVAGRAVVLLTEGRPAVEGRR